MNLNICMHQDTIREAVDGEKQEQLLNLVEMGQNLAKYTPEEAAVIMDFLSNDENFAKLTNGDPAKLHAISNEALASLETTGVTAGVVTGLTVNIIWGWRIWKWVNTKTCQGLNDWMGRNGTSFDSYAFERKARVPNYIEFAKVQSGITKGMGILAKLAAGNKVSDSELKAGLANLGVITDLSRWDNYGGHILSFLNAAFGLRSIGVQITGLAAIILVTLLSFGILYIPAVILGSIWINVKAVSIYKRTYESLQSNATLAERGWSPQAFSQALLAYKDHYNKILRFGGGGARLNDTRGGVIWTQAESSHAHLFCDNLLLALKTEAFVLGTIAAQTERTFDLQIS